MPTALSFVPRARDLVVSPENARRRLETFLRRARKSLDIYDPQVTDDQMLALLARTQPHAASASASLGKLEKKWATRGSTPVPFQGSGCTSAPSCVMAARAFVGSQSLRELELHERREVGVIIRDPAIVRSLQKTFKRDWRLTAGPAEERRRKKAA